MMVIITFTFSCDNQWKSKSMALENSANFFLLLSVVVVVVVVSGHPAT